MAYRVVLTFIVDHEDAAWDIADGLEQAAIKKNYREVNGYVEPAGRDGVLGTEENPVSSSAETIERQTRPSAGVGPLGGEDGRQSG